MDFKTADISDLHAEKLSVVEIPFILFGKKKKFCGEIVTVKVYEDNVLVKKTLQLNGKGKVLVVDGGGSLRCALMGDQVAELLEINQWSGALIYGAIRDSDDIRQMNVCVAALGTHPFKSIKKGEGATNLPVRFGGVEFVPGHYLYADADGIIVTEKKLD